MKQYFFKYQGTGNDFVVFDDRTRTFPSEDKALIGRLCHRRFGVGSDGILLLQNSDSADFHIDFINPDGSRSFCGNGSRCGVAFARILGLMTDRCHFTAIDGAHTAEIDAEGFVHLAMGDVTEIQRRGEDYLLDTGSPHFIRLVDALAHIDVVKEGGGIRYSEEFKDQGVNVNFVHIEDTSSIAIRTYERGVENETLSCGTGVTAAVLSLLDEGKLSGNRISVKTKGGQLAIEADRKSDGHFTDIRLIGPAEMVYSGEIAL